MPPATQDARPNVPAPAPRADPVADLRAALDTLPCAALRVVALTNPPRVVLQGIVAEFSRSDLMARLARFRGGIEVDRIETLALSAGNCDAIGLVRSFGEAGARLELPDGDGPLRGGQPIRAALRMPGFAGFVRLDYLTEDGRTVVHLDQERLAAQPWPADARLLLGPAGDGVIGTVGEPYGRDLLLVTVASAPLLPGARPEQEPAAGYLAALGAAMRAAEAVGARVAADAQRVETVPR